jgi:hypothetical protein
VEEKAAKFPKEEINVQETLDQIDAVATKLRDIPCQKIYSQQCFERERDFAAKKHAGNFHAYRVNEMCDSCAAYWHLSCAMARVIWWSKRR